MNGRLQLSEFVTRLDTALNVIPNTVHVATVYRRDYLNAFAKTLPAVWVAAQRLSRLDDGYGTSGLFRQKLKVDVAIRLVVQRYANGIVENEAELNDLHDLVSNTIIGWRPTGADKPMAFESSTDGPAHESVSSADVIFFTHCTYEASV